MTEKRHIWKRLLGHLLYGFRRKDLSKPPSEDRSTKPQRKGLQSSGTPGSELAGIKELLLFIIHDLPDVDLHHIRQVSRSFRDTVRLFEAQRRTFLQNTYWDLDYRGFTRLTERERDGWSIRFCVPNPFIFDGDNIEHKVSGLRGLFNLDARNEPIRASHLHCNMKWAFSDLNTSSHLNEYLTRPAIRRATVIWRGIDQTPTHCSDREFATIIYNEEGLTCRDLVDAEPKHFGWVLGQCPFRVWVDIDIEDARSHPEGFCITSKERDVLMKKEFKRYVRRGQMMVESQDDNEVMPISSFVSWLEERVRR